MTTGVLLAESVVAPERHPGAWLVDEGPGDDQGLRHVALIPSETGLAMMLYVVGFPFVYRPAVRPEHEEFRGSLPRRVVLVASRRLLRGPLFRPVARPAFTEDSGRNERPLSALGAFLRRAGAGIAHRVRPAAATNLLGDRAVEWGWIASRLPAGPGQALDFGPGGSPLALMAAERGFRVTAVDLEIPSWPYVHPSVTSLRGDLLDLSLPDSSFDLVLNCSSVEHAGLPGRYGVETGRPDGDLEAMARLLHLLRPGGRMLLTVPVGPDGVYPPLCRVYGGHRLPRLLAGFSVVSESFWVKDTSNRWIPSSRAEAMAFPSSIGTGDVLRDVYALGCFDLCKGGPT